MRWEETIYKDGKPYGIVHWDNLDDFFRTIERDARKDGDPQGNAQVYKHWRKLGPYHYKTHYFDDVGRWDLEFRVPIPVAHHRNPAGSDTYEPNEEQLRAQRQAIYETSLSRKAGKPFRDGRGKRLDAKIISRGGLEALRPYMQNRMFRMGTGVQQRDSRLIKGTQAPTRKSILESKGRYAEVDHLIRNRQDYEESLGIARKSGFYRPTKEPTRAGWSYFVWPLTPGQRIPKPYLTLREAEAEAERLNYTKDPIRTGRWWTPPKKTYTKRELSNWLPPANYWRL